MTAKEFDVFESRAIDRVIEKIGGKLEVEPLEQQVFLRWLIREFGDSVRSQINDGEAPF